jgi:hypothetical protein
MSDLEVAAKVLVVALQVAASPVVRFELPLNQKVIVFHIIALTIVLAGSELDLEVLIAGT